MLDKDEILEVDFAALYRAQRRKSSFGERSPADWDRRAAGRRAGPDDDYTRALLARIDWTGIETALDIGCGTGNLAIPLARKLRRVHALDFSREMLRQLRANRRRAKLRNLVTHRQARTDPWRGVPRADLVICSRALGVADLRAALAKMDRWARRRCCATMHAGGSFLGPELLDRLGRRIVPRPDYIYAVNLLYQLGIRARVDFIRTIGGMTYPTPEAFIDSVRWRIGELSAREADRLRSYFQSLPRTADGQVRYRHEFNWAVLAWEKSPR